MARLFTLDDVGAVFTCCLFPEFTKRAIGSVLSFYPGLEIAVVDDACRDHDVELLDIERTFGVEVIRNEVRIGTGRSLDKGLRALTRPLFLSVDHGVEIKKAGIVELLLKMMRDDIAIGAGMKRNDKKCNRAFGPYIDPVFAVWDREFILAHDDLSFKLTNVRMKGEDWGVAGCSTAQILQYRALRLGRRLKFVNRQTLVEYVRHHRTPRTRGRCASPHEAVEVEPGYLSPRRRDKDGVLAWKGK